MPSCTKDCSQNAAAAKGIPKRAAEDTGTKRKAAAIPVPKMKVRAAIRKVKASEKTALSSTPGRELSRNKYWYKPKSAAILNKYKNARIAEYSPNDPGPSARVTIPIVTNAKTPPKSRAAAEIIVFAATVCSINYNKSEIQSSNVK